MSKREKPQSQNACTAEYLLNYTRLMLGNYKIYGRFDMPHEWAGVCEKALAAVAHKLGALDEVEAREVYGFVEGTQEYTFYLINAETTAAVPIAKIDP